MRRRLITAAILASAGLAWGAQQTWPRPSFPPRQGAALSAAKTWGLQLQNVVALSIPESVDALVVDYSRDGSDEHAMTPSRLAALKKRNGAPERLLLCYMSIGEAENYRYYWRRHWSLAPPAWLGKENTDWKGNFHVRFWLTDWQGLIINPAPSVLTRIIEAIWPERKPYIDRILESGCDGVYLDRIDAFAEWHAERGKAAEADMTRFVQRIADYARAHRPGFLIVAQNGEELLQSKSYCAALDGVAKEDLLYGVGGEEVPNPPEMIATSKELLDRMKAAGKPVFVVEYLQNPEKRAAALRTLAANGYLPLFATRALNVPPEPVAQATTAPPAAPSR